MSPKERIKAFARELGFDLCGVTTAGAPPHAHEFDRWLADGHHGEMGYLARRVERRHDPTRILPGAKSILVLGMNYHRGHPAREERPGAGVVARYARGGDYHHLIGGKLESLADFIRSLGNSGAECRGYVDTGPILERDLAQRAGIGWIGKHTNLIHRELGNWFFLGEILTTLELEPDTPGREYCGACTRCIESCPTQAIRAPYVLDARRCISYLTIELKGSIPVELRPRTGNRIFGCDDCLAACPWNRFAKTASALKLDRADLQSPDLIEWMGMTGEQFRERFRGTPIERTKRRGLLRNVAVALGNVGGQDALPSLERARNDPEPLIREHAAWAIDQIRTRYTPQRPSRSELK